MGAERGGGTRAKPSPQGFRSWLRRAGTEVAAAADGGGALGRPASSRPLADTQGQVAAGAWWGPLTDRWQGSAAQ